MDYSKRRQTVFDRMADNSIAVLYSGIEHHVSADEYDLFTAHANRNFFYLTGLRRDKMALVLDKAAAEPKTTLFIEEADPAMERWYGRKVTVDEAKELSGIDNVRFIDELDGALDMIMTREDVYTAYFDTYRHQKEDLPDYNVVKANEFKTAYPGVSIRNLFPFVAEQRMQKDEDEIALTKEAIKLTDTALKNVLANLKPGMFEYEAQADFEYSIRRNGAEWTAFPTIAGSGMNGTMLHYDTNQDMMEDGSLLLMDLGARVRGYNSDITRTYPVNGKYTERQRQVYDIVLEATGKAPDIYRFPGGSVNDYNTDTRDDIIAEMDRRGFTYFDWNVDSNDWQGYGWTTLYTNVLADAQEFSTPVILFHNTGDRDNTVLVIEDIIKALKDKGYKFGSLSHKTEPIQFQ